MSSSTEKTINVGKAFSENLAFRENADLLFKRISNIRDKKITVDFSRVRTMSRSYAHQYLFRKKRLTDREILEVGKTDDITKMFETASHKKKRQNIIDFNKARFMTL